MACGSLLKKIRAAKSGRPCRQPKKLHADSGYRSRRNQQILRKRRIPSRIARPKGDSSERLGRNRWAVERTFAWLKQMRHLILHLLRETLRHLRGFVRLDCSLLCLNYPQEEFYQEA